MDTIKKRNMGIDILRLIAAFFVICRHTTFLGKEYIGLFARFAVPVFFIISGYFFFSTDNDIKMKKKIKRLFILSLFFSLLYFCYNLLCSIIRNEKIILVGFNNILNFIIFNYNSYGDFLWYIYALLYVEIIAYLQKNNLKKCRKSSILLISLFLLIINLLFGAYSTAIFHIDLKIYYTRNFMFTGIPFFFIGYYIYRAKEHMNSLKISNLYYYIMVSILIILMFLENKYLLYNKCNNFNTLITTSIIAIIIFLYVLKNPINRPNKLQNILAKLGEKYSLYIYLFHPLIISVYFAFLKVIHIPIISYISNQFAPIIIIILTIIFCYIYLRFKKIFIKLKGVKNEN